MDWKWENMLNIWEEKKYNVVKSELPFYFIRFFYLENFSFEYFCRDGQDSLTDMQFSFEKNCNERGELPEFPFQTFHPQIRQLFLDLGYSLLDFQEAILHLINSCQFPPCFLWPKDLKQVLKLWFDSPAILEFHQQSKFKLAVKQYIEKLLHTTIAEAELESLTVLTALDERESIENFRGVPAMVITTALDTQEKNIERAVKWYQELLNSDDTFWMEEIFVSAILAYFQKKIAIALFDLEMMRFAAKEIGGRKFEGFIKYLIHRELSDRIKRSQNTKTLEKPKNNLEARSIQEKHFRYLQHVVNHSASKNRLTDLKEEI